MGLWVLCVTLAAPGAAAQIPNDTALVGSWSVERYFQADGSVLPVNGRIFFTERDWTVLFFVVDAAGEPERGSGEATTCICLERRPPRGRRARPRAW